MKKIFSWFKPKKDWKSDCEFQFKDSKGLDYYRYVDEMQVPIKRTEAVQIAIREVTNKISDSDLKAFLENHNKILFGSEPNEKKLELLARHAAILKERTEFTIAAPDLLMNLTAYLYIREDEDPYSIDEVLHQEKVKQFNTDSRGVLADFFYNVGLSAYLPSPSGLRSGTEKLLQKSAEIAMASRMMEKHIAEATN